LDDAVPATNGDHDQSQLPSSKGICFKRCAAIETSRSLSRADLKAKMWKTPRSAELVRNIPDTVTKGNE
jgi:hypothetical protein